VVVGDQGANDRLPGVVVVPDCCGQGEQPLQDPNANAVDGATTMAFQVQLALEGVVDRLDELAKRPEQARAGPGRLAGVGRSQQGDAAAAEDGLGLGVPVALVPDDALARAVSSSGSTSNRSSSTSRSSVLGLVSAKVTGRPCTVQTRCRRRPQKEPEAAAQEAGAG